MSRKRRRRSRERARARSSSGRRSTTTGSRVVAASTGPPWLRPVLTAVAAVYLASLTLNGSGCDGPARHLPGPGAFLIQATCLFPHASMMAIDYRLEVWDCDDRRFREVDPEPMFPIHPDDKESRFQRTGHFHRRVRATMQALERYVLEHPATGERAVGGIRLSSLRFPFPEEGQPVPRWTRPPLEEHPPDLVKHWYYTPVSRRRALCSAPEPDGEVGP